jgi:hypothetical protein
MTKMKQFKRKMESLVSDDPFWALLVFFGSVVAYKATLPRVPVFEDSAEFMTAAVTLGVPHPSGYPLYVLLTHLFTWLPIGGRPWLVGLFSATCATLALVFAHDLTVRLLRRLGWKLTGLVRLAAASVFVAVGLSELWWSQAIFAKPYALHALLTVLAFWLLMMAAEKARCRWVIAAVAVYGLALANHFGLALLQAPFFGYALYRARPEFFRVKNWRLWLMASGLGLAGLVLPYLWMMWRAMSGPPYIMGRISGWEDLVSYVLRSDYADVGVAAWSKAGLFFGLLWQYVGYLSLVLVALVGLGLWRLLRRKRRGERAVAVLLVGLLGTALAGPLAMMLRQIDLTSDILYIARVYGTAAYPFLAAVGAVGLAWLLRQWRRPGQSGTFVIGLLIVFLPYFGYAFNGRAIQAYRDPFPYQQAQAILLSLPSDAVLMVNDSLFVHDTLLFQLAYHQTVGQMRVDVAVVEDSGISSMVAPDVDAERYLAETTVDGRRRQMLESVINDPRFAGRPVYATFPAEAVSSYASYANGLVFRVLRPGESKPIWWDKPIFPDLPEGYQVSDQPALSQLVAHYLYARAAWLLDEQGVAAAQREVGRALQYDQWSMSEDYRAYKAYRTAHLEGESSAEAGD